MSKIVTFGEVMGRLAPESFLRLAQAMPGRLEFTFGGAESNVAASLALLGAEAEFVTALPDTELGDACLAYFRGLGVGTSNILRVPGSRLGLYFVETGANQRPSHVVYDRAHSALARAPASAYPWEAIFDGAAWFHVSGITPAVSRAAAESVQAAVETARRLGLTVSCDLNFRKKLWRWEPPLAPRDLAGKTMRALLPFVDLLIANEEDAADVLGIRAAAGDAQAGRLEAGAYPDVAREIRRQFGQLRAVAITLRQSVSATHNNWGGLLYDAASDAAHFAPSDESGAYRPYAITAIVDRVGGGDAFAAGLIFALTTPALAAPERAVAFAAAASCLAHSVKGDVNYASRAEVEALLAGGGSGRVVR